MRVTQFVFNYWVTVENKLMTNRIAAKNKSVNENHLCLYRIFF